MQTPLLEIQGVSIPQDALEFYLKERTYDALYWPTLFPVKNVNSLSGKTIIGDKGSRVAASIISYNSKAPEASRKSISTLTFDIPKIAIARRKTEQEILEQRISNALSGPNAVLADYFEDVDFVYDGCMAKAEWLALQAISKTKLQLSTTNNPMGIVNETVVDFNMPSANKKTAAVVWSTGNKTTMTPITDFINVVAAGRALGLSFGKILLNRTAFDLIVASTEFLTYAKELIRYQENAVGYVNLGILNTVLKANMLPEVAIVETYVNIESRAGAYTATDPWDSSHVTFVPAASNLGKMFNGPIAEELEKPPQVIQAKRGQVLVSIGKDFNPVSVLTKGECNMFPSWPTIDKCMSLYTASASTWA